MMTDMMMPMTTGKMNVMISSAGATVTLTYELGNCDKYSPGNCCPNSRNGEVRNITSK